MFNFFFVKNKMIHLFLISILSSLTFSQVDTNSQDYYLFSYFINRETPYGAHLAISSNGINWERVNNNRIVIEARVASSGTPMMRDPTIFFDQRNRLFHMVWTTAWSDACIGYASSTDLITWSSQRLLSVMADYPGAVCSWAPAIFYDDIQDNFMIYWSSEIKGSQSGKRTYYCTTKDFVTFSVTKKLFDPGFSEIDADIIKISDRKYFMCFKNETGNTAQNRQIYYVTGPTPQGPWSSVSESISRRGVEGPCAIAMPDNQYYIYFDPYGGAPSNYRLITSNDCVTWKTGPVIDLTFNHGQIIKIPREYIMWLKYKHPLPTVSAKNKSDFHNEQSQLTIYKNNFNRVKLYDLTGSVAGIAVLNRNSRFSAGCYVNQNTKPLIKLNTK